MIVNCKGLQALRLFLVHCLVLKSPLVKADVNEEETSIDLCLQAQVLLPENNAQTVAQLRSQCLATLTPNSATNEQITNSTAQLNRERPITYSQELRNSFFQPYKNNFISFGSMNRDDGLPPFSGENLDIKFELGMKFGLFPDIEGLEALSPLKFGYSQRSWWDISEVSAPFKEHNYNPEIFWDFTEALARPSTEPRLHIFDLVGFEHQSNGLDGINSRSWDRIYATRKLRFSEAWSWTFKYWQAMNLGDNNQDIKDYLGTAEVMTHFELNNWVQINLKTLFGRKSDKMSYQVDIIVPMSHWINSRFFLSYYDGYGEALVSYNQKASSLRAGFYFPLGF